MKVIILNLSLGLQISAMICSDLYCTFSKRLNFPFIDKEKSAKEV